MAPLTRARKHILADEILQESKCVKTEKDLLKNEVIDVFETYKKIMGFQQHTSIKEFDQELVRLFEEHFLPFVKEEEKRYELKHKSLVTLQRRRIIWGKEFFFFASDVLHDVYETLAKDKSRLMITAEELCQCANIGGKLAGEFLSSSLDNQEKPLTGPLSYDMKGFLEMMVAGEFEQSSSIIYRARKAGNVYVVTRKGC
jgi:hypothetical protein